MNPKPSKSAKKREAQNVQSVGERLLALSDEQLAGMPLDDELRELVITTRNISARSALRRQRLYLAKVLRNTDISALQAAIAALELDQNHSRRVFHQAERWRDRVLQDGKAAVAELTQALARELPALEKLAGQLRPDLPEAVQRRLSREIFRQVHDELSLAIQNTDH